MKKILFTLVLAIMTMAVPMEAQKKAATPKNDTVPQIEAYSDTTSLDSVAMDDEFWDDDDAWDRMSSSDTKSLMNDIGVDGGDIMGMFFVIVVLIIIFILAPVGLIGIILFFVYKSRKQKTKGWILFPVRTRFQAAVIRFTMRTLTRRDGRYRLSFRRMLSLPTSIVSG